MRWSTRRTMVAILGIAAALGLGLPAFRAWREGGDHRHSYVWVNAYGNANVTTDSVHLPFTARYRRKLVGTRGDCGHRLGHIEEVCLINHPEVDAGFGVTETPAQFDAMIRVSGNPFEKAQLGAPPNQALQRTPAAEGGFR